MNLNKEKLNIIAAEGNILVTANPGTGKTLLLAGKFVDLLKKGVLPDNILCLTFTTKAKREMEERILKFIKEEKLKVDLSSLNIFTFHSYALENLDDDNLMSNNLLRYTIYRYLKDNETLNYGDSYLVDTIVPKMENLIRYLKSFGITPDLINAKEAKKHLADQKTFTKDDLSRFMDEFIKIYQNYEEIKTKQGIDYADMLINFLKIKHKKVFKYVLVDELQDVNGMEADIALRSGETFFAVGDQKQAIFGFQGGSIINFKKFNKAQKFILSENFRSSNEVLKYAIDFFSSKTKEESHKKELHGLKNNEKEPCEKPVIYDVAKEKQAQTAVIVAKSIADAGKQVAIVARTNTQIMRISKELQTRGIEHSTTFFSASSEAKYGIITFLKGVLSNDPQVVKNAMFTPFFPIPLQTAFEISKIKEKELTLDKIFEKSPEFKNIREKVKTVEDVNILFREKILPVAISYGEDYLLASISVQEAYNEALKVLEDKNMDNFSIYLESSDMMANESSTEKKIIVTSVHKAKGKEFDTVIYVPSKTNDNSNFQDLVVKAILKSKGIDAQEELEEESLRVDFVAITRAKNKLIILTDKPSQYSNEFSEEGKIELSEGESVQLTELKKRAYNLFVNGDIEGAKALLIDKKSWLKEYVKAHFDGLDHISFSRLKEDAYTYLTDSILKIQEKSFALSKGNDIHEIAENMLKKEKFTIEPEIKAYVDNIKAMIEEITVKYPKIACVEEEFTIPLAKIIATDDTISFSGKIDAVFTNGDEHIIVDWKSDKTTNYEAKHRQQLSVYRKVYSQIKGVPENKIKIAIGYCGLTNTINDGIIRKEFNDKQPAGTAFGTITKKIENFIKWKSNIDQFFQEIIEEKVDDPLWRSIAEQYEKEK